jgi:hypothetical protein
MEILSLRRSFDADHSSSSYEFFALKALTTDQRATVQRLTGGSAGRHLSFHYQGEWKDISAEWPDKLLTSGYDILVSESYDWWNVNLSMPHDPALLARLESFECEADGNGFDVRVVGERMVLRFGMQLNYSAAYGAFGENAFRGLANLFKAVRTELLAGDLSAVRAAYDTYGFGEAEEDEDREPEAVGPLSASSKTLLSIMEKS